MAAQNKTFDFQAIIIVAAIILFGGALFLIDGPSSNSVKVQTTSSNGFSLLSVIGSFIVPEQQGAIKQIAITLNGCQPTGNKALDWRAYHVLRISNVKSSLFFSRQYLEAYPYQVSAAASWRYDYLTDDVDDFLKKFEIGAAMCDYQDEDYRARQDLNFIVDSFYDHRNYSLSLVRFLVNGNGLLVTSMINDMGLNRVNNGINDSDYLPNLESQSIAEIIVSQIDDGDIISLSMNKRYSSKVLHLIIRELQVRDFQFVTVSQLSNR